MKTHWHWLILSRNTALPALKVGKTLPINNPAGSPTMALLGLRRMSVHNYTLWQTTAFKAPVRSPSAPAIALQAFTSYNLNRRPRWLGGSKYLRSLDHSFIVSGLHRFSEALGGAAFNLLLFRNLTETATQQWLLEIYFFQSRLIQLFKLAKGKGAALLHSPKHP